MRTNNIDIMCLNETKPTANTDFNIEGYSLAARRDRTSHTGGGGVAILVKSHIDCSDLQVAADDICAITLTLNRQKTCIISCYWGFAHGGIPNLNALRDLLENHRNCILIGDLNAHHPSWGHQSTNVKGKEVRKLCKDFDLAIMNDPEEATFFNHNHDRFKTLDLALMTRPAKANSVSMGVDEPIFGETTYHCPVRLKVRTSVRDHPVWTIRSLKECDWTKFRELTSAKISTLPKPGDGSPTEELDAHISALTTAIATSLHESCPVRKFRIGLQRISPGLRERIQLKHELQREIRQHPDYLPLRQAHRQLIKEIKARLAQERHNQLQEKYESLDPGTNPTFWKDLKRLTNPAKKQKPPRLKDPATDRKTVSDKATADVFARHLSGVHRVHQDTHFDHDHKAEVDQWVDDNKHLFDILDPPRPGADGYSRPITLVEVTSLLKGCRNNTSPGEDTIPYMALKNLPEDGLLAISRIYNLCLRRGYFPIQWKHAIGSMIPKPQKPKDLATSYRPISLLNCLGKLFEKVIATRIQEFADDHDLINKWQRPYQPQKEANEHIHIINQYLMKARNTKRITALLLIDIEKAFDAVWHNGLLKKLHQQGIPPDLLRMVASFLKDRTIQVKTGTNLSDKVHLLAGTPQGSILSPLLFILYVNDIPTSPRCQCTQYADDIAIYTSHRNKNYLRVDLQRQIDSLEDWCATWFIKLNPKKTQLVQVNNKRTIIDLPVKIRNSYIRTTDEATLLGSTFDRRMTRTAHIGKIKVKAIPRTEALRHLTIQGVHKRGLRTFYLSMIRPLLETGYHLTHDHNKSIKDLEKIQNRCLRIITWNPRRVPTRTLRAGLNLPSIQEYLATCRAKALNRYQGSSLQAHLDGILDTM